MKKLNYLSRVTQLVSARNQMRWNPFLFNCNSVSSMFLGILIDSAREKCLMINDLGNVKLKLSKIFSNVFRALYITIKIYGCKTLENYVLQPPPAALCSLTSCHLTSLCAVWMRKCSTIASMTVSSKSSP